MHSQSTEAAKPKTPASHSPRRKKKTTPGVVYYHSRDCADHELCNKKCNPSDEPWEGWVFDASYVDPATRKRGKKIRQRFATYAAAKGWRDDAASQVRQRKLRATDTATGRKTLSDEIAEWLAGAASGEIRNKRQQQYKPGVVREYRRALELRVEPVLGHRRLADITLGDLLRLKEQLQGSGCSDSTVRNTFVPLQAIYRRARRLGVVQMNPTAALELPTAGVRERAATPEQAAELIAALDGLEQALYASAFYSGGRRGELQALRVGDVDLDARTIRVERGWDRKEGPIAPKSVAGTRTVFLLDTLLPHLEPLITDRPAGALVFGYTDATPFEPRAVSRKAERAWAAVDKARAAAAEEAGEEPPAPLERFTLHEARHSFSTWLDHAGVSPDRADRYMGHSSGSVASRYRHLLPAQMAEDARRVDAYLAGAAAGKVVSFAATG
jgi:integrase